MHITQFLLDRVIDLGLALALGLNRRPEQADSGLACVRVETGEMGVSKESLSQDSDAIDREKVHFYHLRTGPNIPSSRYIHIPILPVLAT